MQNFLAASFLSPEPPVLLSRWGPSHVDEGHCWLRGTGGSGDENGWLSVTLLALSPVFTRSKCGIKACVATRSKHQGISHFGIRSEKFLYVHVRYHKLTKQALCRFPTTVERFVNSRDSLSRLLWINYADLFIYTCSSLLDENTM